LQGFRAFRPPAGLSRAARGLRSRLAAAAGKRSRRSRRVTGLWTPQATRITASTAPGPGSARTFLGPIGCPQAEHVSCAWATSPQSWWISCSGGPSGAACLSPH